MTTTTNTFRLEARLNGPARSANGGFACGTIASVVGGTASVRLNRPIPLEVPLDIDIHAGGRSAEVIDFDHRLLAEARQIEPFTMVPPIHPSFADAVAASAASPLHGARHLLSRCVVCGPQRSDGMKVTPGPLDYRSDVLAAPFTPLKRDATDGVVHPEAVWGALDCPSYPAASLLHRRVGLLGTLAAHRNRDVFLGEQLVVVGWTLKSLGRSTQTASALLDERGDVVASARAVWVELRHQWLIRMVGQFL